MVPAPVESLRDQPPERIILAAGILLGVLAIAPLFARPLGGDEIDFQAYYFAGKAILEGEPFVGMAISENSYLVDKAYVYLPITAPLFAVYALFPSWEVPFLIHVGFLLATLFAVGWLSIQYVESHDGNLDPIDRYLIIAFCVVSVPAVLSLYRGTIDPIILLLGAAGFVAVEGDRQEAGGAMWAVASLFKFFPAFFGIWLLYRRAYRGIAAAVAVGLGATFLSVLVFGVGTNVEFVEYILTERSREGAFQGGLDPEFMWITIRRPLSYLVPLTGNYLTLLSLTLMAPVLGVIFARAETELEDLMGFLALLVVLLITLFPSTAGYVVYLLFPLIPLVYLVEDRLTKSLLLASLVLINIPLFAPQVEQLLAAVPASNVAVETIEAGAVGFLTVGSLALWAFLLAFVAAIVYNTTGESGHREA